MTEWLSDSQHVSVALFLSSGCTRAHLCWGQPAISISVQCWQQPCRWECTGRPPGMHSLTFHQRHSLHSWRIKWNKMLQYEKSNLQVFMWMCVIDLLIQRIVIFLVCCHISDIMILNINIKHEQLWPDSRSFILDTYISYICEESTSAEYISTEKKRNLTDSFRLGTGH